MIKIRSYAGEARKWTVDAVRGLYPFLICWIGAGFVFVGSGEDSAMARMITVSIAGISWIWALDLAAARAEAKAKSETTAIFLASLTKGEDTEINVNFYHHTKD